MSRSVSAPSSVTKTSPCWNGLIVPGSTFRYGSNFWSWTRRPRAFSKRPSEAATMPFPSADTTPPVTKTYFGARALTGFKGSSGGGRTGSPTWRTRDRPCRRPHLCLILGGSAPGSREAEMPLERAVEQVARELRLRVADGRAALAEQGERAACEPLDRAAQLLVVARGQTPGHGQIVPPPFRRRAVAEGGAHGVDAAAHPFRRVQVAEERRRLLAGGAGGDPQRERILGAQGLRRPLDEVLELGLSRRAVEVRRVAERGDGGRRRPHPHTRRVDREPERPVRRPRTGLADAPGRREADRDVQVSDEPRR